jgi:cysteine desulfurase
LREVYMDHTAAKPVDPRVIKAMKPFLDQFYGNPSSIHSFSDQARKGLKNSQEKIAQLINAEKSEEVYFTSGATESNNWAIRSLATKNRDKGKHIITTSIEHISVLNVCKYLTRHGFKTTFLPVDRQGILSLETLKQELTKETTLVSVMYANGEIGTIQPIQEVSQIVHDHEAILHVDATAAIGQLTIDVQEEDIDLLTISANSMYGPPGIGGLYAKSGTPLTPFILGGGQQRGLRSGTENLPGIVGMGTAAEFAKKEGPAEKKRLSRLRDTMIKQIPANIPYTFLNGHPTKRLPDNAAVRFSFIEGESILLNLNLAGIAASSGSACTAKTLEPSHVLRAIGLKHEEAHGSVLFTLGKQNTDEDVTYVLDKLPNIIRRLREMSPLTPKDLVENV